MIGAHRFSAQSSRGASPHLHATPAPTPTPAHTPTPALAPNPGPDPDPTLGRYQEVTGAMTSRNGYGRGRAWESVGYHANGEADDWSFGERGVLSMSLEVGSSRDGFWPPPSRIAALSAQSVWPARLLAQTTLPRRRACQVSGWSRLSMG